jgi:spore germination cell wall hydrolase CwlJ-like protein
MRAWTEAEAGSSLAKGALHYYNPSLCNPSWAKGSEVLAEIGQHRFIKVK